jgi:hypothetical protein
MRRALVWTVAASSVALAVAACESQDRAYGPPGGDHAGCRTYTTCGTCTPVPGCGWCEPQGAASYCADDPGDCNSNLEFTWTWDPSGCPRVGPDASTLLPEAAPLDAPAPDAPADRFAAD